MSIEEERNPVGSCVVDEITGSARQWARAQGVPLAYLYADNADLAEVILAFGLLPEPEQRRVAQELKARVSAPGTRIRSARKERAAPPSR